MNPTPDLVAQWIAAGLDCSHLQVEGDGRHFQAVVVSAHFEGLRSIKRHQRVYAALGERMHETVHALSMRTLTPAEWDAEQDTAVPHDGTVQARRTGSH
jgi:acid stress-induced BolA-like protein IbaG/YrbA